MSDCALFKNGVMIHPDGERYEICCQIIPHFDNPRPIFELDSWKEYKSSGKDFELWEKSKTEWSDGCHGCRLNEKRHGYSARTIANLAAYNATDDDNSIWYATINAGNICNLACKMCESGPSSKWGSIARNNPNPWIAPRGLREHQSDTIEYVKDKVLNPNLKQISFAGGEPLQNKVYEQYLSTIMEKDIAKNIKFQMITNGTQPLSDIWRIALQEFKEVEINFSMDGTFDNYDYIRTGAHFPDVIDNIKNITKEIAEKNENCSFGISYCAQALNAHRINHDVEWFNTFYQEHLYQFCNINYTYKVVPEFITHPSYLSLSVIRPQHLKEFGLSNEIENFQFSMKEYAEFMKFNGMWDRVNGTSLKEQNPIFFDETLYPKGEYYYNVTL